MSFQDKYAGSRIGRLGALLVIMIMAVDASAAEETGSQMESSAKSWIADWGDQWWEKFHEDIEAWYPGGRSNRFHNIYIEDAMKLRREPAWEDWEISNQQYIFTSDWFAAEWFYRAVQPSTGKMQIEATLIFGRVQDGKMISLFEYFDDMVGRYQTIGAMRLYDRAHEKPFPWPRNSALRRAYRP